MTQHISKPYYSDPSLCYVGKQPSSTALDACRKSFLYWINNAQNVQCLQALGWPAESENGNFDSTFYIICNGMIPKGTDTDRRYGVIFEWWNKTDSSGNMETSWNGGTAKTYDIENSKTQQANVVPEGTVQESHLGDYDRSSLNSDGFVFHTMNITNVCVANISVFPMPLSPSEYNESTGQDYGLKEDIFNVSQPLRGCNNVASANQSAADLIQHQSSRTDGYESLVSQTRLCLGQWGHAAGFYSIGAAGAAFEDVFRAEVSVRGRNLRGRTSFSTANVDIAFVAQWDDTTALKFTSSIGTTTHSFTTTASSPTLVTLPAFIAIDPRGDEITIEALVSSSLAINIHTISFWEQQNGDEL